MERSPPWSNSVPTLSLSEFFSKVAHGYTELWRLREDYFKSEASLGYITVGCLKKEIQARVVVIVVHKPLIPEAEVGGSL